MKKQFLIISLLALFVSCNEVVEDKSAAVESVQEQVSPERFDKHSYANISEVKTTHLHLDIAVDFEKSILKGSVVHDIENITGANEAVFDVNGLSIEKVILDQDKETTFELGEIDELMGQSLTVAISPETKTVTIHYETTKDSKALQWLDAQQTAGKNNPFLFTQGQAILTRTWIPCQDSPSNRITYSADVTVPNHLMAVMSADNPTVKNEAGKYHFEMEQHIPSYLIAMAVGDITFAPIGDNTGVYAEPSMLDKSVYEFEDVNKMIDIAEELYGEYKWGRYDIIVLPPSFPYGGMENPKLTFATPTILAGDRSLVSLIAHELAHSWSGNLVTNSTWDDFWLNEGFTVYFENRIMEDLYGKEYSDMLFSIEYAELEHENEAILEGEFPQDTKLKLDLEGRDPDEGMTAIAYVKGALFLKTIEDVVGRPKFDVFLNGYFKDNEFKTLTTEDFLAYLETELLGPNEIKFNIDAWVYGEGIPENCVKIESNRFQLVEEKAKMVPAMISVSKLDLKRKDWSTQEWIHFIREIPEETEIDKLALLDKEFSFKNCGNSEIMSAWYILSIRQKYNDVNADMETFLINVGRRKFLEPIYTELAKTTEGMELAKVIYEKARPNYHSISYTTIDEILNWNS